MYLWHINLLNKVKMYTTALFDLDGVILDTEPQYTILWDQIGEEYYPELKHFAHRIKGQTLVQIFEMYFRNNDAVQRSITNRINEYEREMQYHYILGVKEFIEDLRQHQINTAVVTSSNLAKMKNVYRKYPEFGRLFDKILTSEDFVKSKPHPGCYLQAAANFQVPVSECVVFEDSINGLKAAKAANMTVCGLSTTLPASEISSLCDVVIPHFKGFDYPKFRSMFG